MHAAFTDGAAVYPANSRVYVVEKLILTAGLREQVYSSERCTACCLMVLTMDAPCNLFGQLLDLTARMEPAVMDH